MIVEESIGGAKVEDLGVLDGDVVGGDDVVVVGDGVFALFGYDYSVFSAVQEEQEESLDYAAVDYGDDDDDGDDVTVSDH